MTTAVLVTFYKDYVDQDGNGVALTSQLIKFTNEEAAEDGMAAIDETYKDTNYEVRFTVLGGVE